MIGIRKPSLHFYSKQIVFYESNKPEGIINILERFKMDQRSNIFDKPNYYSETFLVVIDKYSKERNYWSEISKEKLGAYGIYDLLRIKKDDLNQYVTKFKRQGFISDWKKIKFEKF